MARIFLLSLILAGIVSLTDGFAPRAALAGPNVPLCLAMQNNYNECVRHERARERHRHYEYEDEWGRGPRERRRHSDCGAWLVQLKAQGCF
ncbi:hypothetical protein A1351_11975 [Methylosinus sp. R-45379]|uniref:hypothetical protein n=1 Tax=unclassified Methylosinus TaxID=2624500 RepID=UPI0004631BC2|nr:MULTISPECIES: hypothetical protein [unclassified Methylosinus]OAI28417.1 hypothetical protein A1351_11975 [Methylosinus sp. R-45379]TDX66844.1 hypothetical protein EDE12_101380 [Methylosinus sp. sav-2]